MATRTTRSRATRRTHTPIVLQMEAAECGAACLTTILNYYGRDVRLEEVREACAVSRDGVNALRVVAAGTSFGLEAHGYRCTADEVRTLDPPFVVFWNQNHFLVVEGTGRRKVHLNDPASGHRSVSPEEFDEGYSGVVLRFHPSPDFRPDPRHGRRRPVLEMLRLLAGSRGGVVYAVLAGVAVVVPVTAAAILAAIFVDQVLGAQNHNWVSEILLLAATVTLLVLALNLFQQRVLLRLQTKLSIRMSAGFLWHLLRLPTRFFDSRSPGALVSRVQLNSQVAQLLSGQVATAAISAVTMALFAVVLLALDWILALVALAIASFNAVVLVTVSRRRIAMNESLQQMLLRLSGFTFLGVSMIDDIKATGSESEFFARWAGTQAQALNTQQRLGFLTQSVLVAPPFLTALNTVVILAVGGLLVIDGHLGLTKLVAFQLLAASFFAPITQLISVASQFQNARAWTQQIGDVLGQSLDESAPEVSPALARSAGAELVPTSGARRSHPDTARQTSVAGGDGQAAARVASRLRGRLELRGVAFGYVPNERPTVADLDITIEPGQRVALVGPSGSGKSTVANLIAGLLHPWAGEILFDGMPREAVPPEVMAASLSIVDQSVLLFSGTVADNIRFWDRSIAAADVVRAAEDACIADTIEAKAGGFGHLLAEGGRNFSGGERQRLEFARALATNPTVLVLDEATSALDPATEELVDTNLRRRGCSCLIIAQRLSTIRDSDQIIVLERGNQVERGTHDELLALDGVYSQLVSHE